MPNERPDVVLIVADDMGYSDIGCYGGEVHTPWLDRLGRAGIRFSQFYNSPRCSPSRASLLTGLYPHQTGVGILNFDDSPEGYPGNLSDDTVTIPEVLGDNGYATYMSGKWHVASDMDHPSDTWPTRRGFDRFFGTLDGAASYYRPHTLTRGEESVESEADDESFYYTDAITDNAVDYVSDHHDQQPDDPLFLYLAYTAPHWPLHAFEEDVAAYRGRFDAGWDRLREERLEHLVQEGILPADSNLSERDPAVPAWDDTSDHEWQARRMEVYAAQIERLDRGIGRVITALEERGRLDNTLVIFLSDNGGCAEEMPPEDVDSFVSGFGLPLPTSTRGGEPVVLGSRPGVMPGPETTYSSYGRSWANLSNTPFRQYKHWVHEGGISAPCLIHWPAGLDGARIHRTPAHLPDVLPTVLDAAGADYPTEFRGRTIPPMEGRTLLPQLRGEAVAERPLFWEHEGNAGVRRGRWKLVRMYGQDWELYDITSDRAEQHDRALEYPEVVRELTAAYDTWARRCGVIPRERVLDLYERRGSGLPMG